MKQSKTSTQHPESDLHLESLSALCDGELGADEARFLLRRLAQDGELRMQWYRVHRVRACIQREYPGPVSLVDAVRLRLDDEPLPVRDAGRWRPWLRVGLGGAIAASVAMVAVVGLVNRVDPVDPGLSAEAAPAFVGQTTALDRQFSRRVEPAGFGGAGRDVAASQLSEQQRINRIMIRHSQVAGGNGFISFTPVLAAPASVNVDQTVAAPLSPVPTDPVAAPEAEPAQD
jgi:negative regulator of sigma E activity